MQYFYFLQNLLKGEMGKSITYKIDVLPLIATRIEPTLAWCSPPSCSRC